MKLHHIMGCAAACILALSLCGCDGGIPAPPGMEHSAARGRVDVSEIPGAEAMADMLDTEAGKVQDILLEHGYTELVEAWGEPDAMGTAQNAVDGAQAVWVFVADDLGGARIVQVLYDTAQQEDVRQAAVEVFDNGRAIAGTAYENLKESGVLDQAKETIKATVARYYTEENKQKCRDFLLEAKDVAVATAEKIDWDDVAGKASDAASAFSDWLAGLRTGGE